MKSSIIALFLGLISSVALASDQFSIEPYIAQCGGKIYAKCDSPALNQETIFEAGRPKP